MGVGTYPYLWRLSNQATRAMNTIELTVGHNLVLSIETHRLVFKRMLHSTDSVRGSNSTPQGLLKLMDSLDLDGENGKERRDLLQKVPHHGIDLWLQVQIFYDHVNCTTQEGIDNAAGGRLRKLRPDEAWDTIEKLAQYENEGWNDTLTSEEVSFNYENPNVEQLLGIMERKVDTLMKDTISLIGSSEDIFRLTTNKMSQPPTEPSRQEEFEHIVMNYIYDQEERIKQLENYMQDITDEFMEFFSKVALRLNIRGNLFRINEPIYRELVCGFFASFNFDASLSKCNPSHLGQSIENTTLCRLRDCNTVREDHLLMEFWPCIGNDMFNVGNTKPGAMAEEEEDDEVDNEGDEGAGGDTGQGEAGVLADPFTQPSQKPGDGVICYTRRRHNSSSDGVTHFKTASARTDSNADLEDSFYDGVFSTWMAFGGNTRDLGSFGEETDEITDLHQILEEVLLTERGDGVAGIKRRRRDPSSDGVRDLVTASGRSRLNEDLESST
ncbi:hypothetical protein Tco_0536191 [Tanacetum coccineum]